MASTRRKLLVSGGASLLPLAAGCLASSVANEDDTATSRSTVTVRLSGPDENRALFDGGDVRTVGEIQESDGSFGVRVTLSPAAASRVENRFRAADVDEHPGTFEVVVLEGNQETTRFGIEPAVAERIAGGDWDGDLRMTFEQRSTARSVRKALVCGVESPSESCDSG
jgi:hypothetical protein